MNGTGLDGRCTWCRALVAVVGHAPGCITPGLLAVASPPPPAGPEPTSRELFAAAQRAGTTVGHEWGAKTGHAAPE